MKNRDRLLAFSPSRLFAFSLPRFLASSLSRRLAPWIVFFLLYALTTARDILPADSGEFQLAAAGWGILHPPGYPLYTLAGALWVRLIPVGSIPFRLNLLSAALAATTLVLVMEAVRTWAETWGLKQRAALTGGLAAALLLGAAPTFWAQSTTANIRMPTLLFAAWGFLALAQFKRATDGGRRPLLSLALGVLLFAGLIEMLPMTALAAILIYAGFQTIKPQRIRAVWNTNSLSRVVMVVTFIFTLFLQVQQAVFLGVALQVILYVFQSAERMEITELIPTADGDYLEGPAPDVLQDWRVTMLVPHGSLFFAGAADFEEEAPSAEGVQGAVVVLILRGRKEFGSTALNVFQRYAEALQKGNGRLILAVVNDKVFAQLERTGSLSVFGSENIPCLGILQCGDHPEIFIGLGEASSEYMVDLCFPGQLLDDLRRIAFCFQLVQLGEDVVEFVSTQYLEIF